MPTTLTDREAAIAMAMRQVPPREIAAELGLDSNQVSCLLYYERQKGRDIPRARRGGSLKGQRFVIVDPPRRLRQRLVPHAEARGLTVSQLAGAILDIAAEHGLIDAILDDGGADA